jgi:hypothetical protein
MMLLDEGSICGGILNRPLETKFSFLGAASDELEVPGFICERAIHWQIKLFNQPDGELDVSTDVDRKASSVHRTTRWSNPVVGYLRIAVMIQGGTP